ncbi:MAG: glycosyltransferase [Paludibacteraceae bacterium]|nr:glycosyltransferase [Paludibacteraceae bacterium]
MKLSIITINRNNAEGLRKTMESVLAQTYRDFEYIVVDGASSDHSVEVIKELTNDQVNELKNFTWITEPDTGIYEAMNKGLKMCQGEYTLMLNSGDYLVDEHVIERIMPELDGTDIIQGNTISQREGVLWRDRGYGKSDISFLDVQRGYFLHQASFCKESLFEQYGYFNEHNRYVSDTEFFIKTLGFGGASFKYVDIDIANFDSTGFSSSKEASIRQVYLNEEYTMQHRLFPGRLYAYCRDSERKVELFDALHKHKWLWYGLMALKTLHNWIYGERHVPISEKIKK